MPKLTVIYEDAGFKAVREVAIAEVPFLAGGPIAFSEEGVAKAVHEAVAEVRRAQDAHPKRDDNILPGPGGIPA